MASVPDGTRRRPRKSGRYTPPKRVLYLVPSIPDDAPEALKNSLAVRNAATATGRCPGCGELRDPLPDRFEPGAVYIVRFRHADSCPALLVKGAR